MDWIDVKKELPTDGTNLICHKHNGVVLELRYENQRFEWRQKNGGWLDQTSQVTHWKYFDKPPTKPNSLEVKDYSSTNPKPSFYANLFPELRQIAIDHGYALALHGSVMRDMDLIAVAWVTDAKHYSLLVEAMVKAVGGFIPHEMEVKDNGRICFNICLGKDWVIDLSIVIPFKK